MAGDAYRQVARLAGDQAPQPLSVSFEGGDPVLQTPARAADAAAGALAAASAMAQEVGAARGLPRQAVTVNARAAAASLLGFFFQRLNGDPTLRPADFNPSTNFFRASCGRWIYLHGGFPRLLEGLLKLLDCENEEESLKKAVARWDAQALEDALAYMQLCGAVTHTPEEWRSHPQGQALAQAPIVELVKIGDADPVPFRGGTRVPERPLAGVRVLDLTRVLAGPTCGRTLASHGADVLRVGAAHVPTIEPFVIDTGHGKRNTWLDFSVEAEAATLRDLASSADVVTQSYRPGALERHGFGPEDLHALRPGIVYVSVNCYGHEGPFARRPGFEQLAQSASGLARWHADETAGEGTPPTLLPAAATDYTTGYLAAFGALVGLLRRAQEGGSWHVRVSLARTGMWMMDLGRSDFRKAAPPDDDEVASLSDTRETPFGTLRHLRPADTLSQTPPHWDLPPSHLGSAQPIWKPA